MIEFAKISINVFMFSRVLEDGKLHNPAGNSIPPEVVMRALYFKEELSDSFFGEAF